MKNYIKKSLLILGLSTATSCALADGAPYIGAGLGLEVNTAQQSTPGNFRGIPFELLAGYGGLVTPTVYLAGELNGTFATLGVSGTNTLRSNYTYGASFIPGVMLNGSTMAYGKVGVVRTQFNNPNHFETGGRFGVGLQTSLSQNVDLRGGYDYTTYGTLSGTTYHSGTQTDGFHMAVLYKLD